MPTTLTLIMQILSGAISIVKEFYHGYCCNWTFSVDLVWFINGQEPWTQASTKAQSPRILEHRKKTFEYNLVAGYSET